MTRTRLRRARLRALLAVAAAFGTVAPLALVVALTPATGAAAADLVVTAPTAGATVTGPSVVFSGTSDAGSVQVVAAGTDGCTAAVDANSAWSCTLVVASSAAVTATATWTAAADGGGTQQQQQVALRVLLPAVLAGGTDPVVAQRSDGIGADLGVTAALAGAQVVVTVDGSTVCSAPADDDGALPCALTTPLASGDHAISAQQTDGGVTSAATTTTLRIPAAAEPTPTLTPAPTPTPTVTQTPTPSPSSAIATRTFSLRFSMVDSSGVDLSDAVLHPGQALRISSTGLPAGTRLVATVHSEPVRLGAVTASEDGTAVLRVSLPESLADGSHTIRLEATAPSGATGSASARISVAAAQSATPAPRATTTPDPTASATPGAGATSAPGSGGDGSGSTGDGSGSRSGDGAGSGSDGAGSGGGTPGTLRLDTAPRLPELTLTSVQSLPLTWLALLVALGSALVFLALVAVPAELLDRAIARNEPAWFGARRNQSPGRRLWGWRRVASMAGVLAAAAVLLALAEPAFPFSAEGLRLLIAAAVAVVVVNLLVEGLVALVLRRPLRLRLRLQPLPVLLLAVAASVVVSRIAGLEPAFLVALVVGLQAMRSTTPREDGVIALITLGVRAAVGVAAWAGYSALPSAASGADGLLRDVLAALTISSFATLVISLLPIRMLDGGRLFRWHRRAWTGVSAIVFAVFVLVVVPPPTSVREVTASAAVWLPWVIGFAALCVAVWAWLEIAERRASSRAAHRRTTVTP